MPGLLLIFATLFGCISAQAYTPLKAAVVDLPRIFAESNMSTDMKNKLSAMESDLKAKLKLAEQKLTKQEEELSRRRASPKRKENLLKDGIAAYQELANKGRTKINRLSQKGSQKILNKVTEVVKSYAAEHGIHLVLPSDFVIFHAPVADITGAVIARLNLESSQIDLHSLEDELEQTPTSQTTH